MLEFNDKEWAFSSWPRLLNEPVVGKPQVKIPKSFIYTLHNFLFPKETGTEENLYRVYYSETQKFNKFSKC